MKFKNDFVCPVCGKTKGFRGAQTIDHSACAVVMQQNRKPRKPQKARVRELIAMASFLETL